MGTFVTAGQILLTAYQIRSSTKKIKLPNFKIIFEFYIAVVRFEKILSIQVYFTIE